MARADKQDLVALARRKALEAGIPEDLVPVFLGQIEQESGWNPRATSAAGAKGLGQLMPGTARDLGVKNVFDPEENLGGAARYFKDRLDQFGDTGLALAAYNWGPGNVQKMLKNPRGYTPPKETLDYVPSVMRRAMAYGSTQAPADLTLAFFPGTSKLPKEAVNRAVAQRTGGASAGEVVAQVGLGAMPTGEKLTIEAALDASQPPAEEMDLAAEMGGATSSADLLALAKPKSMDGFLKAKFGPIAGIADVFPKAYDKDLLRMIDEA